jgi:hypothetical protein
MRSRRCCSLRCCDGIDASCPCCDAVVKHSGPPVQLSGIRFPSPNFFLADHLALCGLLSMLGAPRAIHLTEVE